MASLDYAIIEGGVVVNVVVVDDPDWVTAYEAANPTYTLVEIDSLDPKPGIGWTYANGAFTAPTTPPPQAGPTLVAQPTTILGDGATASTVTLTWPPSDPSPPSAVIFNVNGVISSVPLVNGTSQVNVTSVTSGSVIRVLAAGVTVAVTVT